MVKVGYRKPSWKKSIAARTYGRGNRAIKRAIFPKYGKRGMGWVNNPKKAAYNYVYNRTTKSVIPSTVRKPRRERATGETSSGGQANTEKAAQPSACSVVIIASICISLFAAIAFTFISVQRTLNRTHDSKGSNYIFRSDLDMSSVYECMRQSGDDLEKFGMNERMGAYLDAVQQANELIHDENATQRDVNDAVKRIEELRKDAISYHEPEDAIQTANMPYSELCSHAQENVGKLYHVEGRVVSASGSFNSDYYVTVAWNDSDAQSEFVVVRIPETNTSRTSISVLRNDRYFLGCGYLEGFYRDKYPCFRCSGIYETHRE